MAHPGRWLWLLLAIPITLGLLRLRFDIEVFDLLPSNLPAVHGLKLYQQHFANARELIITLEGKNAEETELAAHTVADHLRLQTNLVANLVWEPPWLEHPEQAAELMAYLWFNRPPGEFAELTNRLAPAKLDPLLTAAREELSTSLSPQEIARISYDPFGLTLLPESIAGAAPSFGEGQDMFSSSDGLFRVVFVQARPELATYKDCQRWLAGVKEAVQAAMGKGTSPIRAGYTGRPVFVSEIAGGMEHDMTISAGGTAVIIAVLFWLAHRRIKPMLWLLTLLALILGSTLALGGLIFGAINVVSMGFAGILLGLAVDYAVVHYQEALAHPGLSIPQIRHAIAPSIFWAGVTTIAAFLVLNFGGLPGLAQLGTLVGLGVALAATIMIFEFLPPLFPGRNVTVELASGDQVESKTDPAKAERLPLSPASDSRQEALPRKPAFIATGCLLLFCAVVLRFGIPAIDPSGNALRPRGSPAYEAVDRIQARLNQKREAIWLVVGGHTVSDVAQRLDQVQAVLESAVSNNLISDFKLPSALWPRPDFQSANRALADQVANERAMLRDAAIRNGFAERSLALAEGMLNTWQVASAKSEVFWPTNPMSRWIFEKFAARSPTNDFALGLITPKTDGSAKLRPLVELEAQLPHQEVWLSGWELLGTAVFTRVQANLWKVVTPMVCLVLLSLYLAFRRPREILLSLAVLGLSGVCLLATMRLAGWSWNLLNLMAIPLVLGTGVDYSIFMQQALRRHRGDLMMAHESVGKALLLCGGTAIAGFGSLAFSRNAGMASLGQVCAVGVGTNMLIAIFLLPQWWQTCTSRQHHHGRSA